MLFQSFRAVVDKAGLAGCKRKPVEFLVDRFLGLVEEKEIQIFQVNFLFLSARIPIDLFKLLEHLPVCTVITWKYNIIF